MLSRYSRKLYGYLDLPYLAYICPIKMRKTVIALHTIGFLLALNPWLSHEGYQLCLEGISPFSFRDQLATQLYNVHAHV